VFLDGVPPACIRCRLFYCLTVQLDGEGNQNDAGSFTVERQCFPGRAPYVESSELRTLNSPVAVCVIEDVHTIIGSLCLLAIVELLHWAFPNSRLGIEFVAEILAMFL